VRAGEYGPDANYVREWKSTPPQSPHARAGQGWRVWPGCQLRPLNGNLRYRNLRIHAPAKAGEYDPDANYIRLMEIYAAAISAYTRRRRLESMVRMPTTSVNGNLRCRNLRMHALAGLESMARMPTTFV